MPQRRKRRRQEARFSQPQVFGMKRQRRLAAGVAGRPPVDEPPRDDTMWEAFTPTCILNGSRCLARMWGGGVGAQCRRRPLAGGWLCRGHHQNAPHGQVNGSVPEEKLPEFLEGLERAQAQL